MAWFHHLEIFLVLLWGDWFLGEPSLSVVPLSKIAPAAAEGCVSLPWFSARDAISFSGYFSSFSLEQLCVLPPFPRAVLNPAVQGGLTGVDGQRSEKWDQYCKKTAGDPEGRSHSLLQEQGTQAWRGRLSFLPVWQPKASMSGLCIPSRNNVPFSLEWRKEVWVGLTLWPGCFHVWLSCLNQWGCVRMPSSLASFWNRITQELHLRHLLTFSDSKTELGHSWGTCSFILYFFFSFSFLNLTLFSFFLFF